MRLGLISFFTEQLSDAKGVPTINARAESAQKSTTWRKPFKQPRCLIPASAFMNGNRLKAKTKQPHDVQRPSPSLFASAGLRNSWKNGQGIVQSFSNVSAET